MGIITPEAKLLKEWFPFTKSPFVANAPMWEIATQGLATGVSKAGGLGFIGAGPDTKPIRGLLQGAGRILHPQKYHRGHDDPEDPEDPNVPLDSEDFNPGELEEFRRRVEELGAKDKLAVGEPIEDKHLLEVGVGIICFVANIKLWIDSLQNHSPCAVWLFGPRNQEEFELWINTTKAVYPRTKIFCQIGSVTELTLLLEGIAGPNVDVIVAQGVADAGGHGINQGASIVGLIPQFLQEIETLKKEGKVDRNRVIPIIAAGGIMDGRGCAAALALGAAGVVLGTRFILSEECTAAPELKRYIAGIKDGGQQTIRTRLYDTLRGNGMWAPHYNARSAKNDSYYAYENGMSEEENTALYQKANSKTNKDWHRLTMYCGTGIGLISPIKPSKEIAEEVREDAAKILMETSVAYPGSDNVYKDLLLADM